MICLQNSLVVHDPSCTNHNFNCETIFGLSHVHSIEWSSTKNTKQFCEFPYIAADSGHMLCTSLVSSVCSPHPPIAGHLNIKCLTKSVQCKQLISPTKNILLSPNEFFVPTFISSLLRRSNVVLSKLFASTFSMHFECVHCSLCVSAHSSPACAFVEYTFTCVSSAADETQRLIIM